MSNQHENAQKEIPQYVKPSIKANQLIIEDDDGYVEEIPQSQFAYSSHNSINKLQPTTGLRVEVDYEGKLSPQVS